MQMEATVKDYITLSPFFQKKYTGKSKENSFKNLERTEWDRIRLKQKVCYRIKIKCSFVFCVILHDRKY